MFGLLLWKNYDNHTWSEHSKIGIAYDVVFDTGYQQLHFLLYCLNFHHFCFPVARVSLARDPLTRAGSRPGSRSRRIYKCMYTYIQIYTFIYIYIYIYWYNDTAYCIASTFTISASTARVTSSLVTKALMMLSWLLVASSWCCNCSISMESDLLCNLYAINRQYTIGNIYICIYPVLRFKPYSATVLKAVHEVP